MVEIRETVQKHALANAYSHGGKAVAGAIVGRVLGERPELKKDIAGLQKLAAEVAKEVNKLDKGEQEAKLREIYPKFFEEKPKEKRELPELPGALKGKVVTRLAPEPNGYLHIGHAISFFFNQYYADKYNGKLWLRFEDTNPEKEQKEYYESIRNDLEWLGIRWDREKSNSDDIELFYKYAHKLIEGGHAYVCTCPVDMMRKKRMQGIECDCRKNRSNVNLDSWADMQTKLKPGSAVLRLKGDIRAKNTVMRDPTLFRIVESPHPLQGSKYRAWPLYDFANAIEDAECGVTHVLRSNEFLQRNELQNKIRDLLGLKSPVIISYSRIQFSDSPTSKRQILELMEKTDVESWDDPRLATIMALRRRGVLPETLRQLALEVRMTKGSTTIDSRTITGINRKLLNEMANRYFFVPEPVKLEVKNAPSKSVELAMHPEHPERGARKISTKGTFYISRRDRGKEFRLKDLYNVKNDSYDGDELRAKIPKIQWVTDDNVKVELLSPEGAKLNKLTGLAEPAVKKLKKGDIVQFERVGFARIEEVGAIVKGVLAHK